jgi:SulP family sulfate permease
MANPSSITHSIRDRKTWAPNLLAGLTFALVNIPQAMAHALMAAVNPIYGLYTLIVATPVGALFSSATFMNISSTSALSVAAGGVIVTFASEDRTTALVTLVFMIGIFQILLGVFKLGMLSRFISYAVMTGFMTGVAVLIILGQLEDLTGYNSSYDNKIAQAADILLNGEDMGWASLAVGLLTILLIYVLAKTRLRYFSMILALMVASIVALIYNEFLDPNIQLVGDVAELGELGLSLHLPSLPMVLELLVPAISIGIIGLVQGVGVSQAFPNPDGKFSDVSRDFTAQGVANLAGGLAGGIPAGGSSSGTALVVSAGATSRLANIFAGVFVAIVVILLGNQVEQIAMPALAGLVIVAGIQMINLESIQRVWHNNPVSRALMLLTFATTLVMPLQYAVIVGVVVSLLAFVLQQSSSMRLVEWRLQEGGIPVEGPVPEQLTSRHLTMIYMYGSLFFAAADAFEKALPDPGDAQRAVVILGLRGRPEIGATVLEVFRRYVTALSQNDNKLILAGVDETLMDQLTRTGMLQVIGEENIFPTTPVIGEAMNAAVLAGREWTKGDGRPPTADGGPQTEDG